MPQEDQESPLRNPSTEIQNQLFDEKANLVIITVLCCSPEKVMDKISCKGGESVRGIEIVKPPPPKPKEPEKPKLVPVPDKPKDNPQQKTVSFAEPEKPKQADPAPKPAPAPAPAPAPQPGPPPPGLMQMQSCCRECYGGCGVGPCYSMMPAPPCYGRPVYDSWGGGGGYYRGGGYYVTRGECLSDDNTSGCVVM
ncbi:hypothetical protein LINGRAHAP2_LOCUS25453 [Linum grandiflorum]